MRKYSWTEVGMKPIRGPFSKYMTPEETAILVALVGSVAPKVMIEFGCNLGVTAKRMLDNVPSLERYIGIDVPHNHVPILKCQDTEVPTVPGGLVDDDRFLLLIEPTETLTIEQLEPCDAVFIDGDHSYSVVSHDSLLARALVRNGGIICWHDYGNPAVQVNEVISELCADGWPINYVENSWLAFMRKE